MRFASAVVGGYQVFAVAGVNSISFGVDADPSAPSTKGLLGFAVERVDKAAGERYYMRGYKVFPSVVPNPGEGTVASTYEHPVQSFVWDDFTAKPDTKYRYIFHPLKGSPKALDRSTKPIPIDVCTEPLVSTTAHDIFFNRGVASSQAYAKRFQNKSPDDQDTPDKKLEALDWLSRDLDDAMLRFIDSTAKGDGLRCAFYEFRFRPAAERLVAAVKRGVDVRIIIDAKDNAHLESYKRKDGTKGQHLVAAFPRDENLGMVGTVQFPLDRLIKREARASNIAHNKFMVLLRGPNTTPTEVWTGSTNLSNGGVYGQANVGHHLRDAATAQSFLDYWDLLAADPGGRKGAPRGAVMKANAAFEQDVDALASVPTSAASVPTGVTAIFSPRTKAEALDLYAGLLTSSRSLSCVTLAFGVTERLRTELRRNTPVGPLCFLLLEKADLPPAKKKAKPKGQSTSTAPVAPEPEKEAWVHLNSKNNVYEAYGSDLNDPLGQWVVETDTGQITLGDKALNSHVRFMHCKFLLHDPLGKDPIVVTGSANFSPASSTDNDENMLLIRGDLRVADIYFTEFNRLFNHYYFRSIVDRTKRWDRTHGSAKATGLDEGTLSLTEDDSWLAKYGPGTLRTKRVDLFKTMHRP